MPGMNLVLEYCIDHFMLLDDRQASELGRLNLQRIHGSTATAFVLDLERASSISHPIDIAWHPNTTAHPR